MRLSRDSHATPATICAHTVLDQRRRHTMRKDNTRGRPDASDDAGARPRHWIRGARAGLSAPTLRAGAPIDDQPTRRGGDRAGYTRARLPRTGDLSRRAYRGALLT